MKLKKMMSLILCAVLVTIGSVYATWDYTTYKDVSVMKKDVATVTITDKVITSVATGSINVVTDGVTIKIHNAGDHKGELQVTGDIVITFTPGPQAPQDVQDNGIDMKYNLEFTGNPQYKGQNIFRVITAEGTTGQTKSFTISAAELLPMIGLNQEVSLPTEEEYDAFISALTATPPRLQITVSQNA